MQPLGDMTFNHVITGKLRTLYHILHDDTITKLGWNTYANKMMLFPCVT